VSPLILVFLQVTHIYVHLPATQPSFTGCRLSISAHAIKPQAYLWSHALNLEWFWVPGVGGGDFRNSRESWCVAADIVTD
jgi:hypothetical protein